MKKYYYLLDFSKFSLGITNEKKLVKEKDLISLRSSISKEAASFASHNFLKYNFEPVSSKSPTTEIDIFHYYFKEGLFNKQRFLRHLEWLKEKEGKIPTYQIHVRTLPPREELVGREKLIEEICSNIVHNHVSLRSPRCYGKTSILNAISESLPPGWKTVFLQMYNLYTPQSFVGEIACEISQTYPLEKVKVRDKWEEMSKEDWCKTMKELLNGKTNYLFLLDEFTEFLRHLREREKLEEFLKGFEIIAGQKNIRFVSASSKSEKRIIGHELKGIKEIIVPLLEKAEAKILLEELAYNSEIIPDNEGEIDKICTLIGDFVPYFIHIFVHAWQEMSRRNPNISVEEVYNEGLISKIGWNLLREFQNLKDYPQGFYNPAFKILHLLSLREQLTIGEIGGFAKAEGLESRYDLNDLLDRLEEDLLIKKSKVDGNEIYVFSTKVLRDFWKRYPKR